MKNIFVWIIHLFLTISYCAAQEYSVLGIGSPVMDILFPVEHEFLQTISGEHGGSVPVDWNEFSRILQYGLSKDHVITSGGSAANTIKGLAHLKNKSAFLGTVGNDEMGKSFTSKMTSFGVIPILFESNTPTTQVIGLITHDGQRTFRYFAGASIELSENNLTPELFSGVKLVHLEVYSMFNGQLVEKAAQLANDAGAVVSLDLGSFEVVNLFKTRLLDLITNYVDIVFSNENEIHALTGLDPESGGLALKDMCKIAVIKMGKHGCWVMSGDEKIHSLAIPVKAVIDTTGAGDHFASGFLHGFLAGQNLHVCAHYGNLAGGAAVEVFGAEIPEEKWIELRALMPPN